ncbi:hypothetical protein A2982_01100 [candidate division WWE3 bacterium RIFCSPLOWO2_01_FULL_39_13]|uniref:Uncharacterized protein n=1 Tax=candidate division WWE3 bacterium RIFCSPLOWO2_01_FULL_39_13 TaxID=1802624 RepID=A0A1F4V384_UNCKA|nr:MAG: hypothetical protein A2982_01100 [candidate division WWE3 bacterium RIFCSPLOWO2_01_FULL_39_13]
MKQVLIVLDSAGGGKKTKYGSYICFWAAFIYDPKINSTETAKKLNEVDRYEVDILHKGIKPNSIRSGATYLSYEDQIKFSTMVL